MMVVAVGRQDGKAGSGCCGERQVRRCLDEVWHRGIAVAGCKAVVEQDGLRVL